MANEKLNIFQSQHNVRFLAVGLAITLLITVSGYFLLARFDFETIYSGLNIEEAAMLTAELDRQKLQYKIGDNGSAILVPKREIGYVRLALHNADGLGRYLTGFELFNESEMGLTDFAQKIKFQRAMQGELSRTIMMMEGVKSSRVHIALPERSVFRSQRSEPKAAVIHMTENGEQFTQSRIFGLQRLVASSITELSLNNVIIIDEKGHVMSPTGKPDDMIARNGVMNMGDGIDQTYVGMKGVTVTNIADKSAYTERLQKVSERLPPSKSMMPKNETAARKPIKTNPPENQQAYFAGPNFLLGLIFSLIVLLLVAVIVIAIIRRLQIQLNTNQIEDFALELSQALGEKEGANG